MFIQTEATPNPNTLKFLPGRTISPDGPREFESAEDADASPLAADLFLVDGVSGVFFGEDFIAVTKTDEYEWDQIKPFLLGAIMDGLQSGEPILGASESEVSHAAYDGESADVVNEIIELIDTRVRPAVANDGGDILFHSYAADSGIVRLRMRGACSGCPSSTMTLKAGIENLLKHYIPEIQGVEAVE
ncbi:NifU family protein [Maricaulis sp.]|uniref:NifU family protein n=1 Tax=Maricaulis sp. TaxID=1486257 RepID=UPI00262B0949|nr:NifU family protein [Maricaulis sp.]